MAETNALISAAPILDALNWRFAAKQFDPTRQVAEDDISALLEASRLAPTSQGIQPFHVTVVTDAGLHDAVAQAAYNQKQPSTASHLLIFSAVIRHKDRAESLFAHATASGIPPTRVQRMRSNYNATNVFHALTGQRTAWAAKQAYIALGVAVLTASKLRIDNCPMEGFRSGKVATLLKLPKGYTPTAILALGYRLEGDGQADKFRLPSTELFARDHAR